MLPMCSVYHISMLSIPHHNLSALTLKIICQFQYVERGPFTFIMPSHSRVCGVLCVFFLLEWDFKRATVKP